MSTPAAGTTERVKEYWERRSCGTDRTRAEPYSRAYFDEIEEFRYRHEPFIHEFAQFSRWRGRKVLEVGVGAGTDFVQFVRAGAEAHGVDLTEEAIRNVRARLALEDLKAADLRATNAESLPYPDGTFDLVYSWGVIHHAADMEKVLAEMYRVTRPGGRMKVMIYNVSSPYAWAMWVRHALLRGRPRGRRWAIWHFQESFATKVYTRSEVRSLLARFPHRDLRFHGWDQLIRDGARFGAIRRLVHALTPDRWRWYLGFELVKAG